jgi:hypothetical protein
MNVSRFSQGPVWSVRAQSAPRIIVNLYAEPNLETGGLEAQIKSTRAGEQ